ncbi:MAG: transglutaminase-like domain-containing protein [Thermomicrobium sp.]|nr:transglutaminase-like domain-containing protein [Thermomicrobium sp.]
MLVFRVLERGLCISLPPTPRNQCLAIQHLIRPHEVEHIVHCIYQTYGHRSKSIADSIATWLKSTFRRGGLRYISDPLSFFPRDLWCSPAKTLERRGGDCDDLAILVVSLLQAAGVPARVVLGDVLTGTAFEPHAWVEGADEYGRFLIEPTDGRIWRIWDRWPLGYRARIALTRDSCHLLR